MPQPWKHSFYSIMIPAEWNSSKNIFPTNGNQSHGGVYSTGPRLLRVPIFMVTFYFKEFIKKQIYLHKNLDKHNCICYFYSTNCKQIKYRIKGDRYE